MNRFTTNSCASYIGDKGDILAFREYVPSSIYFDKGGAIRECQSLFMINCIQNVSLDEGNSVDFQQINLRFPNHKIYPGTKIVQSVEFIVSNHNGYARNIFYKNDRY